MLNEAKFKKCIKTIKSEKGNLKEGGKFEGKYIFLNEGQRNNANLVCNINEVDRFLDLVKNPLEDWKTVSDIILDFRMKKLKDKTESFNIEYIKELLDKEDYINIHKYLKIFFLESFDFALVRQFLKKIDKIDLKNDANKLKVKEIMNTYKLKGYTNCIMYIS